MAHLRQFSNRLGANLGTTAQLNKGIGDRQYYEQWYASRNWRFYVNLLRDVVLFSQPGPVLDVGAGTGFFVEAASRWGFDCRGIEGSSDAIEIGVARYPTIKLQQHKISDPFPFEADSFQTVVMNQVIEHLEPAVARSALTESARVLKRGGMILITSPSRFNRYEATVDPTHINMLAPSELRTLVSSAGFDKITSMDFPLPLLGDHFVGRKLMTFAHRLSRWERLSASANCRAFKR